MKTYVTIKGECHFEERDVKTSQKETAQIKLDPQTTYQTWLGFGAAATEAAGFNYAKLSEEKKQEVMKAYYTKEGLNYNFIRISMGSCDFSLSTYDYLESGMLDYHRDDEYVMPLLNDVKRYQKDYQLLVSPWSPPAFMKDNGIRNFGGHLLKNKYDEYATYYASYLCNLKNKGFDTHYVTAQNEPAATQTWDSCLYEPLDEYELALKMHDAFLKNNISPKILVWDHNRDILLERVEPIYQWDQEGIIAGCGIHWYDKEEFHNVKYIYEKYPNRLIMHTEGCLEGGRKDDYFPGAERYARNIIGDMNAGTCAFIDWNLFLDEQGGPNWVGNYCDAPIMVLGANQVSYQESFYAIKHLAHFIHPGDVRIECQCSDASLFVTAFLHKARVVIVVLNQTDEDKIIKVNNQNYQCKSHSMMTLEEE